MTWAEILAAYPFLQPLLDSLKLVTGDAYHLLLSGIRSKQKAKEALTLTQAIVEAQSLAPHATISYQENQWSITVPGQQPTSLALPPAAEMRMRLDQRRYDALSGVVAEAAVDLKDETSFPGPRPSEDWLNRFVESASQFTDQTMQELWGRILAGEIKKPQSFSIRTINLVSNLPPFEAKLFEGFGRHAVRWKFFGFIPEIPNNEFLNAKGLGFGTVRLLADCGLANPTQAALRLLQASEVDSFLDYGRNRAVFVQQKSPPVDVQLQCWTLTNCGTELLPLVEREADPNNMEILLDVFRRHGLQPKVGSWALKGTDKVDFTSDEERESQADSLKSS